MINHDIDGIGPKGSYLGLRSPSAPCGVRNPALADFDVGPLDGGPGNPVRGFFLPDIAVIRRVGVIESLAIDVLGVIGEMSPDGTGQIGIC